MCKACEAEADYQATLSEQEQVQRCAYLREIVEEMKAENDIKAEIDRQIAVANDSLVNPPADYPL